MKPISIFSAIFVLLIIACNNSDQQAKENKSDNDMDAARNFIQAALEGNFKKAANFMLQDTTNQQYLDVTERNYKGLDAEEKRKLKEASLRFYDPLLQNDSITVTVFANSYRNDKDTLKIIKKDNQWLVDLKYLFEHDNDTLINHSLNKTDTIHK